MQFTLHATAPYDFRKTLNRVRSHHELVLVKEDNTILRAIRPSLEADPIIVQITPQGTVDEPKFDIRVIDGHITNVSQFQNQIEQMLTAKMDIRSFYQSMEQDPVMSRVIKKHYGLRLFTDSDLFESLVRTIIGQQITVTFASTLTKRLSRLGEEPITIQGQEVYVFPTPSQIAQLSVEQLRNLQFSTRKAEYIINIARMVVEGTLNLEKIRDMNDEEVMATLLPIRGIGRWTVECLLLFGMGRPNLLPAADIGLRNAVRNEYGIDQQATEAEIREIGARWSPYCSYATYYLWETLNNG